MIIMILGLFANATSFILWLPQARTTWKNKNNPEALQGISLGTQVIAGVNTSAWCIYGLLIHDIWLPLGTLIVLPLALWTIVLKLKAGKTPQLSTLNPNELIEYEDIGKNGYFEVNIGDKTLCDHQGQQKLKYLENVTEIAEYCRKYKITTIKLSTNHYERLDEKF
ncbi:SemiSWEET family sugar transporter [Lactococcus garvieae]